MYWSIICSFPFLWTMIKCQRSAHPVTNGDKLLLCPRSLGSWNNQLVSQSWLAGLRFFQSGSRNIFLASRKRFHCNLFQKENYGWASYTLFSVECVSTRPHPAFEILENIPHALCLPSFRGLWTPHIFVWTFLLKHHFRQLHLPGFYVKTCTALFKSIQFSHTAHFGEYIVIRSSNVQHRTSVSETQNDIRLKKIGGTPLEKTASCDPNCNTTFRIFFKKPMIFSWTYKPIWTQLRNNHLRSAIRRFFFS